MNKEFLNFLKSTFYVSILSSFAGFGGFILGFSFIGTFLLFFVLQYILFYAVSSIATSYFVEKTKQKELDKLENLSTVLNCAYCNKLNVMTFLPQDDSRLEFECEHCNKKNVVTLQFFVARVTEPVTTSSITGIPLKDS